MADYGKLILNNPAYDTEGIWVPKRPGGWLNDQFFLPTGRPMVATAPVTVSEKFVPVETVPSAIGAQLARRPLPKIPAVSAKTSGPAAKPMQYTPPAPQAKPAAPQPELETPPTITPQAPGALSAFFRQAVAPEAPPMQYQPPARALAQPPEMDPVPVLERRRYAEDYSGGTPPLAAPSPEALERREYAATAATPQAQPLDYAPAPRPVTAAPELAPPPQAQPQASFDDSFLQGVRSAAPKPEAPPMKLPDDVAQKLAAEPADAPVLPTPKSEVEPPEFLEYPHVVQALPKIFAPATPPPQEQPAQRAATPAATKRAKDEGRTALPESKGSDDEYEWYYTSVEDPKYPHSWLVQPPAQTGNRIVVSIPDKKVVVYSAKGQVLREYQAYIGNPKTPTPRGEYRIMEKSLPYKKDGKTVWRFGPGWLGFAYGVPGQGRSQTAYYGFHSWKYTPEDDRKEGRQPGWKTSTAGCVQLGEQDLADFARVVGVGDHVTVMEKPLAPPPPKPPQVSMKPVPALPFGR